MMDEAKRFALDVIQEAAYDIAISKIDEQMAYAAGYDCGWNGANEKNCDFRFFRTPEMTREWEKGKEEAGRHYARGNYAGNVYLGTD
jgi:hypothetical protein